MYNILLVDDEAIILRGIERKLSEINYFSVYSAVNGKDALDIVDTHNIHAMILDINMPEMNGLQLLEMLLEKQKDILVVMLSGYDEFEYAQKALKLNAFDYILKPIDSNDVQIIGERIKEALDKKKEKENEHKMLIDEVRNNHKIIKERFFLDILHKKLDNASFEKKRDFLDLRIKGNHFRVAIIEICFNLNSLNFEVEEELQVLLRSIEIFLENVKEISNELEIFHISDNGYIILFSGDISEEDVKIFGFLEMLKKDIEAQRSVDISIGVGDNCNGILGISTSYEQASKALKRKLLLGEGYIYSINDFSGDAIVAGLNSFLEGIYANLITVKTADILKRLEEAFNFIRENKNILDPFAVQFFTLNYISILVTFLQENGINVNNIPDIESNFLTKVFDINSIDKLESWICELVKKICNRIIEHSRNSYSNLVSKMKLFINDKYFEDLSVNYLSAVFNFSPNYLGHIFKNEMEMTLNEYINKVRVEGAKKLLKGTKMMIYEIAYKCGFSDQHYFSQVFKKIEGLSPKEYRDN